MKASAVVEAALGRRARHRSAHVADPVDPTAHPAARRRVRGDSAGLVWWVRWYRARWAARRALRSR
ncbi:MAG TPA: hypothetical protein VKZ81_09235 [Pseudonocardia sp.]|uniref:hypothetical protein n=1 Tax=Pseudonocardia sp. TaxID=60912 RepID=UPI002B4ABE1C|nr:hypothetical protein [Pseudonocardia sp.]HLU55634.1 hypothetical protein [Pseudonocardia sp.]